MHPRQVELVLREKTRARTFSVIRVVQTEGLAAEAEAPAARSSARKGKKKEARTSAKKKGKAAAAAAAEAEQQAPEKVIGISLPPAHAQGVLDAIAAL